MLYTSSHGSFFFPAEVLRTKQSQPKRLSPRSLYYGKLRQLHCAARSFRRPRAVQGLAPAAPCLAPSPPCSLHGALRARERAGLGGVALLRRVGCGVSACRESVGLLIMACASPVWLPVGFPTSACRASTLYMPFTQYAYVATLIHKCRALLAQSRRVVHAQIRWTRLLSPQGFPL